jgi:hypothetical protein
MTRMRYDRSPHRSQRDYTKREPSDEVIRRAAARREAAKRGVVTIVKHDDGIICPTCGKVTERRTHASGWRRSRNNCGQDETRAGQR